MILSVRIKRFIAVVVVGILIIAASCFVIYSQSNVGIDEIVDPETPFPPSSMPMGVYSKAGVVSNGGPCAQIGVDVLSRGGNAVDAAIATLLCDGAQCPEQAGLGGGFLMSIYNATTKKVTSINAREKAPAAATTEMFVQDPKKSLHGGLAVAVPGALKGYSMIYNLYGGKVSWESLFEPTISLCEDGLTVSEHLAMAIREEADMIRNDTLLSKAFLHNTTGDGKKVGDVYKLPELAKTMRIVAKKGVDAIYNGLLTSRLIEDIKNVNGIITEEDLKNYNVEIEESFPVKLKSGYTMYAGPPPGSGMVLAYILRILDGIFPAPDFGLSVHRFVEACKFGYGERSRLGDHKFVNVSQIYEKVKSDKFIDGVRSKISDTSTSSDPNDYGADFYAKEDHGTGNIVVIDSEGNVVVCTSTINTFFGSGVMSPSTGIILNNEMDDFSTPGVVNYFHIPSSPSNFIKPGKRPMSSMAPTVFTDKNGDFVLGLGAAGGSRITITNAWLSVLKLLYNKTLKEAVDEPRILHQLLPMQAQYEYGTTRDVVKRLKDIGHPVKRLKHTQCAVASAISKSPSGLIEVMSDFRRPGNTSGY